MKYMHLNFRERDQSEGGGVLKTCQMRGASIQHADINTDSPVALVQSLFETKTEP